MTATYRSKPSHGPVPFGLCGIGTASLPTQDVRCTDCAHSHRMTAPAVAWLCCRASAAPGERAARMR